MFKFLLFIFVSLFSLNVLSLEVTLTQGSVKPTPIAITNLFSLIHDFEKIGKNISDVISDNLERSGLFYQLIKKLLYKLISSLLNNLDLKIGK